MGRGNQRDGGFLLVGKLSTFLGAFLCPEDKDQARLGPPVRSAWRCQTAAQRAPLARRSRPDGTRGHREHHRWRFFRAGFESPPVQKSKIWRVVSAAQSPPAALLLRSPARESSRRLFWLHYSTGHERVFR